MVRSGCAQKYVAGVFHIQGQVELRTPISHIVLFVSSVVGRLGLLLHQKNYTTDDDDERFCIIDGYGDGDVNSTDDEDERFYIIDGDGDVNSTYNDDIEMI